MTDQKLSQWLDKNANLEKPIQPTQPAPTPPPIQSPQPSQHHKQVHTNNKQPVGHAHKPIHKPVPVQAGKPTHQPHKQPHTTAHQPANRMRIIPLGGLEEVGKNITAIEYGNDIILIDCGMSFAGPEMFGVDYIVPDVTYLQKRKHNVRGIIFTHGHLDHIGAAQYVIPKLGNPPLYATKLTAGLLKNRLREFALDKSVHLNEFNEDTKLKLGAFEIEFFRVNHSIPDGVGVFIKSPAGTIVHSGDFKFDYSPAIDKPANMQRIAEIGSKGIGYDVG